MQARPLCFFRPRSQEVQSTIQIKTVVTNMELDEPTSAPSKPALVFDNSAINRLADDDKRGLLEEGIRAGFRFRFSGDTVGEVIATTDAARRKLLLGLCKRLVYAGDCLLPHDELLKALAKHHAKDSSFNWKTVPVRCNE